MAKTKKVVDGDENHDISDLKSGIYEVGYIMVPNIAEENLGGEVSSFKDKLTELGAIFISDEYPKMMELAYEMSRSISNKKQKFTYGYFGWVKFEATTQNIILIKKYLDLNETLVRFLMIKTVRASTMSIKKTYTRQDGAKRHSPKKEEPEQINEAQIDQEIEALVI